MRKVETTDKVQSIVIRTPCYAYAVAVFVTLTWSLALRATAQGLVGAPIHIPSCDSSYDTAIGISRVITAISFLITFFIPLAKSKRTNLKLCALELIALASIP
jgi:hypothetical protein